MRIAVTEAIQKINTGKVVGLPTDTVYGLAAHPDHIEKLFVLKNRKRDRPFLMLVASCEQISSFVEELPPGFDELAKEWPGPLSLVIPVGVTSVGFRMPNHPLCLEVLEATGPLAVTSANLSDEPPALDAAGVEKIFGSDFPVLDGGPCPFGRPSRILAYRPGGWQTLRS